MKTLEERQISWLIIIVSVLFTFFMVYAYIYQIGNNPITLLFLIIFLPIFLFILSSFYEMKTIVFDDRIEIKYGFGIIKKVFYLKDLSAGIVKKIPWWYGAGIKYYGKGTLYSINFTNAVEFKLKYKNRCIAIGSKNAEALMKNVNKAIDAYNHDATL